jgi:hypothetical protein
VTEPEIALSCSDGRWRAVGLGLAVEHRSLRGLEALLEKELGPRGVERVALRFDTGSLPVALRQYMAHYFNCSLHVANDDAQRSRPA